LHNNHSNRKTNSGRKYAIKFWQCTVQYHKVFCCYRKPHQALLYGQKIFCPNYPCHAEQNQQFYINGIVVKILTVAANVATIIEHGKVEAVAKYAEVSTAPHNHCFVTVHYTANQGW